MKKIFFMLWCVCAFSFLQSNVMADCSQKGVSGKINREALRLVNRIWRNSNQGNIHAIKHMMTHHFTVVLSDGTVGNREAALDILKGFRSIHVHVEPIRSVVSVIRNGLLIVYYSVTLTDDQHVGPRPYALESIFQRIHGKWRYTAQADGGVTPKV